MTTATILAALDYADASVLVEGAVVALTGVYVLIKAGSIFLGFIRR